MDDEPRVIEATIGPYAGQRLTVPAADADAAIADGWARDPFAPPPDPDAKDEKQAEPPSEDEMTKRREKAEAAARKLRGEKTEDEAAKESESAPAARKPAAPASPRRDMRAGEPGPYETK